MVVLAYDYLGVITSYKVPQGMDIYKDFLRNTLRPKVRKNRPGMLKKGVIILRDSCQVHATRIIVHLLAKYGLETLPHPAYIPDLSPCDYDPNPRLKEFMREVRFWGTNELMARLTQEIRRVNRESVLDRI